MGDSRRRVHLLDSQPGVSMAIVRFIVGEDEEKSIVRLNQKMFANFDLIPPGASPPLIKPRSIDDVPILALTLSSKRYGDLRAAAHRRPGSRHDQAGGACFRRHPDRRAAARGARSFSTRPTGGVSMSPAQVFQASAGVQS